MLTINFLPQFNEKGQQEMSWHPPIFTVNCTDYDLSLIPDGASVTPKNSDLLHVERNGNDYIISVILNAKFGKSPYYTKFPKQQKIIYSGDISVPIYEETEL